MHQLIDPDTATRRILARKWNVLMETFYLIKSPANLAVLREALAETHSGKLKPSTIDEMMEQAAKDAKVVRSKKLRAAVPSPEFVSLGLPTSPKGFARTQWVGLGAGVRACPA